MKDKIMYITHETDVHGASKMLLCLIEKMQETYDIYVVVRGHGEIIDMLKKTKCHIFICPYYLDVEPYDKGNIISRIQWPIRVFRYLLIRNMLNYFSCKKIKKFVLENNITLIHSNSSSTFIGMKIAKMVNLPHIWHFREFLEEDFKLKPLVGWKNFYKMASTAKKIIVVSNSVLEKYSERIETDIVRVYDGVEISNDLERKSCYHKEINLLQVGVLSKGKGTDIALEAVYELNKMGLTNVELYLAGTGGVSFCQDIYEKICNNVHLLGYVEDLNKLRIDKNIDMELVCSRSEAFGLVTVEAMAAGNPVLGANTAGTKELIVDHFNGLLFEQGNAKDLAKKIKELIYNPILRRELGKNGIETCKINFSVDKCIKITSEIYEEILRGRNENKKTRY